MIKNMSYIKYEKEAFYNMINCELCKEDKYINFKERL